MSIWAV